MQNECTQHSLSAPPPPSSCYSSTLSLDHLSLCSKHPVLTNEDDPINLEFNASTSNYASTLLTKLSSMRDKPDLCDFKIIVNDKTFLCNMSESYSDYVVLKGFENSIGVQSMLNFAYSGVLSITFDNIMDLLHSATHLQIHDAIQLCSTFLITSLTINNCVDIYKIADLYTLADVLLVVKSFIPQNFIDLMLLAREQFEQLNLEQLCHELQKDTLDIINEYDLFNMVCLWISSNRQERLQYSSTLMKHIRFMLMTPEELVDKVIDSDIIRSNDDCKQLILDALCYYSLPKRQPLLNTIQCRIRNEPVLVAVGETELFTLNAKCERWDSICQAPLEENYPYPFAAITVNNYLYVLGTRRSTSEEYKSCYRFSTRTFEWTKLQPLLHDRSRFAAAYIDKYIYIMGGFEGFKRTTRVYVNTIERYSIENDHWESFSNDGPQLSSLASCAYDDKIYLGGGKNGQWSKIADFYCFDINKKQLERRASMLSARTTHNMTVFDQRILAIGGFDDDGNGMLSIESYDVKNDQWTILTNIPGAISKTWPQSLGTVGRRIYISVFHTSNSFIVMQEGYYYNLDEQKWIKAPVVHERARYCPTVQLRFPKSALNNTDKNITNNSTTTVCASPLIDNSAIITTVPNMNH
ncbi:unnamed protein product [Didymodactylos carnosus]|uniref:BACK domain-containing protein n=1 Tax=Didymodactylos carnosus TaxID=1234261 RepID=A0A813P1H1_9BILA|nr:unnamed protein product [Didymodactylos carnosus]CAF3522244.1 unnamed protein product [Didymodactylos carnosus]